MGWKKIALLVAVALVAMLISIWAFLPKPVEVELAEVKRGRFEQVVEEDAKTRVRDRYVVSAPLAGKVQRLTLKAGDIIQPNEVVARITPSAPALLDVRSERELRERLGAAEARQAQTTATVARAKATLEKSRADLARAKQLAASRFVSASQVEQAELEVKVNMRELEAAAFADHAAMHEAAEARAAMSQARSGEGGKNGGQWQVRAPVAGSVLKVVQESEGVVAVGTPLLEIGAASELEIVAEVLTTAAVDIPTGAAVRIERWGKPAPLLGRVRRVEPSAFTKVSALGVEEQRVNVLIDFVSPRELWQALGDGYKLEVKIIVFSADQAITVPVSALFRKQDQWAVFVAENGRARERQVRLARRGGVDALVEQGLQPGDKVIVYPGDRVKDGARIKVRAEAQPART